MSSPESNQQDALGESQKKRFEWNTLNQILAAVTAVLVLIATIIGIFASQQKSKKDSAVDTSSQQSQDISSLQSEKSSLESENSSLKSRLSATPTSEPPGPSGTLTPGAVTVRHHANHLVMYTTAQGGSYLDLDSPQSNVQWTGSSENFGWGGNFFDYSSGGARALIIGAKAPTYDSCRTSTGWGTPGLNNQTLMVNDYFCFQTVGKRYAIIKVLQMTGPRAIISIVVYDPPADS